MPSSRKEPMIGVARLDTSNGMFLQCHLGLFAWNTLASSQTIVVSGLGSSLPSYLPPGVPNVARTVGRVVTLARPFGRTSPWRCAALQAAPRPEVTGPRGLPGSCSLGGGKLFDSKGTTYLAVPTGAQCRSVSRVVYWTPRQDDPGTW